MNLTITIHKDDVTEQEAEQMADLIWNVIKPDPDVVYAAHTNHTIYPQEAE